jgi:hypothetical protein
LVCLSKVERVGLHVDWKHSQSIKLDDHEGWVLVGIRGETATD